ncbi:MAG: hypothetical protein JST89_20970 [Cyanobacteria bacterium SZAS-4]|nr:hypothetical protein [Cyanobacteria bacterium SZAS-4]
MVETIARTIEISEWNSDLQQKASEFWTNHGMKMSQDDHCLHGRRGGVFDVLLSAKPIAISSELTITSMEPTKIDCVIKACTTFQMWCIWDKTIFDLELSLFDHFLRTGDARDEHWKRFSDTYQKHYWMANMTGGLMGLTMSADEKSQFRADIDSGLDIHCGR